jgi:UDP-GlcNAc:undecaprenyl-phosphate GlcNAc-1-phosphate transferase
VSEYILYLFAFAAAFVISLLCVPICRFVAVKLNILDHPVTKIKTHSKSIPYLGGIAVAFGWGSSLIFVRFFTNFPTGVLRSLRALIIGSLLLLILGFIDDLKLKGLGFKIKFLIQFAAAAIGVFFFDIRIHFIDIYWISCLLSVFWIVGVTNAFNIIDIMDGLSSGVAAIASFAFLLISLPTEMVYVNFCAAALAGALLAFIPFNLSESKKIFMGDTGSLFVGFIMANLALGSSYSTTNDIGFLSPLLILAVPIYEVFLVSFFRMRKKILPFIGTKDHYALRLIKLGFSKKQILAITYIFCAVFAFFAYLVTKVSAVWAALIFVCVGVILLSATVKLAEIKVE